MFRQGLFKDAASIDLQGWDDDDWRDYAESVMRRAKSDDTKVKYQGLVNDLLSFASAKLGFSFQKVGEKQQNRAESIRRALVIRPTELDVLAKALIERASRQHKQIAAALLLGYYAGLRPREVRDLPLNCLFGSAHDLHIKIVRSKNLQSSRLIPLHLLAPQWVLEWFVKFRDARMLEFRSEHHRNGAAFFGLKGERAALDRESVITPAIGYLKALFGKNAVFYSLRHSFASLNFVRVCAFGYPQILDGLADAEHPTFSQKFLADMRFMFAVPEYKAPDLPVTALITLVRLMGHSGYATLFERYIHTLHIVLGPVCAEWFEQQRMTRLSDAARKNLTGRSSSSTLAKMPKDVGGMIKYLAAKG